MAPLDEFTSPRHFRRAPLDIRHGQKSAKIGRPTGTRFDDAQLQRAWTATGIHKMR